MDNQVNSNGMTEAQLEEHKAKWAFYGLLLKSGLGIVFVLIWMKSFVWGLITTAIFAPALLGIDTDKARRERYYDLREYNETIEMLDRD